MTTHSTSRYATTMGPFLTLLVLTALRGTNAPGDRLATVETAPVEIAGERTEFREANPRMHCDAHTLGPFLTLILTLHRRGLSDSGAWQRSCVSWQSAPFVRIHASA